MNEYKRELLERLAKANEILKEKNLHLELVVVGGSAFVLKELISRATYDIDSLAYIEEDVQIILREAIDVNSRVLTFEATFGDWREDLEKIKQSDFSNIKLLTISTERLIASRCFSLRRTEDAVESIKLFRMNKRKFEDILIEIKNYSEPIYTREFLQNEELIIEIYKLQEWDYENSDIKNLYKR